MSTTTPYFCVLCSKRSPFPIAHKTLGLICQHCLRPLVRPAAPARQLPYPPHTFAEPKSRKAKKRRPGRSRLRRSAAVCVKLAERDGWVCHLCGDPIDPSAKGGHQPTIDHLIPRSEGGSNAQENLKLAHRRCNQRRGNAPLLEAAG